MAVVWLLVGGRRRRSASTPSAPRSLDAIPDISDPQIVVYVKWPRSPQLLETEVTEPLISALAGSPDIQSIRGTSHMGYSFIYVILRDNGARREPCSSWSLDRHQRHPAAAAAGRERRRSGPNASSMGWIYQYALVDQRRHARPARAAAAERKPDQAGAADGARRRRSRVGRRAGEAVSGARSSRRCCASAGIPLRQVIAAVQGVFQEAGGRMIEVTNRDYQLRGVDRTATTSTSSSSWSSAATEPGRPVAAEGRRLPPGRLRPAARAPPTSTAPARSSAASPIMEQDQNVLAVTQRARAEARAAAAVAAARASRSSRPTIARRWIWATLRQFFETLGYRAGRARSS